MSLTLSIKTAPFPYAAVGIAAYTQKAELNFDESATGISLALDGLQYTSEDEIVAALAKAGRLDEGKSKVRR